MVRAGGTRRGMNRGGMGWETDGVPMYGDGDTTESMTTALLH